MRLIDANAFKDYIDCGHLRPPTKVCFSELDVCNMIDKRPTIDAVEVVRCKDCRWYEHIGCAIEIKDNSDKPKPDDFCSFGERRIRLQDYEMEGRG